MIGHFISKSCAGVKCACGQPATHKVGEEIPRDEPSTTPAPFRGPDRHNFTAYVCCGCFRGLFGGAVFCP